MSLECRHFVAYTGVKLPFKFVNEITDNDLNLRNTYFKAYYDKDTLVSCQKIVYGEVEFEHQYEYYPNGTIRRAKITEADTEDVRNIEYNEQGIAII
jgi:hypothetical protein